jgi:hypothetical protein
MSQHYDNPDVGVYRFPAATLSTGAVIGRIIGPAGKRGRLIDVGVIVTTGVTVAANTLSVGDGTDADAYGVHTTPVAAAASGHNGIVRGVDEVIDANSVVVLTTGGECTAGAGDVLVTIGWF